MSVETAFITVLLAHRAQRFIRFLRITFTLAIEVTVLWVTYKAGIYLYRTVNWKSLLTAHVWLSAVVLSIIVLVAGVALFIWKLDAPVSYGFSEVSFGILSGFMLLLHIGTDYDPTRFMGTIASIYIISRGLNNVKEGLEKAGFFESFWPLSILKGQTGSQNPTVTG
jgi:hypothetical protein